MKPSDGIVEVLQNSKGVKMEVLTDSAKLKELFKQAIIEAMEEKKDVVHDLLVEAMEDLSLIHAIQQGEETESVSRDEVFSILEGKE